MEILLITFLPIVGFLIYLVLKIQKMKSSIIPPAGTEGVHIYEENSNTTEITIVDGKDGMFETHIEKKSKPPKKKNVDLERTLAEKKMEFSKNFESPYVRNNKATEERKSSSSNSANDDSLNFLAWSPLTSDDRYTTNTTDHETLSFGDGSFGGGGSGDNYDSDSSSSSISSSDD